MKIALAQINSTVGDIDGNTALVLRSIDRARAGGADLVVFPELTIFGYPPKDLVRRRELVDKNVEALHRIAAKSTAITTVVGYVKPEPSGAGNGRFNAAAVCRDGEILATYAKMLLPTYDVFDETRYFNAGREPCVVAVPSDAGSTRIGVTICEDLWNDRQFKGRRVYDIDPVQRSAAAGAELLVNLSGSPYRVGIQQSREDIFIAQAKEQRLPLAYVNQIGGQDDLLFDGASLFVSADGEVVARARAFEEDWLIVDTDAAGSGRPEPYPERLEGIRRALVLGVRDYMDKCGFERAILGLSGGIDSALTAALAVQAVGADRVQGVALPSRYSSGHSVEDARLLAENLGIDFSVMEIENVHRAMEDAVSAAFARWGNGGSTVAEENIQARIRGNILMALSNKSGALLLTTGNKSELAVGYCTLYGDMCGGLAVLSDVPKTVVYELSRHLNEQSGRAPIPQRCIDKAPSAELRENQCDQDTLPPYDVLDAILEHYVEAEMAAGDIVAKGFDRETVERVTRMVDRSEHKRNQAAVGLKVTSRAFGTGRRMPIAARVS